MPLQKLRQKIRSHTIAESVILPACCQIANIMFAKEYEKEIFKIPKSGNSISQCIQDMSHDSKSQVIANIKETDFSAIQLDESIDITGKPQLPAFSMLVCNGDITEQFLFCKPFPETTNSQDILDAIDIYFTSQNLSWKS
jgi:hypothetical protein